MLSASILSYSACVPMNLMNTMLRPKSKATMSRKFPPATSSRARSPLRIFAFGAAARTSSIDFHLAALIKVLQRSSETFVSGCFSANEDNTLHETILMRQHVPKTGTTQEQTKTAGSDPAVQPPPQ